MYGLDFGGAYCKSLKTLPGLVRPQAIVKYRHRGGDVLTRHHLSCRNSQPPLVMGSTETVVGMYKILAGLRTLKDWGRLAGYTRMEGCVYRLVPSCAQCHHLLGPSASVLSRPVPAPPCGWCRCLFPGDITVSPIIIVSFLPSNFHDPSRRDARISCRRGERQAGKCGCKRVPGESGRQGR